MCKHNWTWQYTTDNKTTRSKYRQSRKQQDNCKDHDCLFCVWIAGGDCCSNLKQIMHMGSCHAKPICSYTFDQIRKNFVPNCSIINGCTNNPHRFSTYTFICHSSNIKLVNRPKMTVFLIFYRNLQSWGGNCIFCTTTS